jgi:hypothetical protein
LQGFHDTFSLFLAGAANSAARAQYRHFLIEYQTGASAAPVAQSKLGQIPQTLPSQSPLDRLIRRFGFPAMPRAKMTSADRDRRGTTRLFISEALQRKKHANLSFDHLNQVTSFVYSPKSQRKVCFAAHGASRNARTKLNLR